MEIKGLRDPGILEAKKFRYLWRSRSPFSGTVLYYYCILLILFIQGKASHTTLRNISSKASNILQLTSICNIVYYIKKLLRNWGTLDWIIVHIYLHTWGLSSKKLRDPGYRQPAFLYNVRAAVSICWLANSYYHISCYITITKHIAISRFPEIGVPPVIIHFNWIFHYKTSSYWGYPHFRKLWDNNSHINMNGKYDILYIIPMVWWYCTCSI